MIAVLSSLFGAKGGIPAFNQLLVRTLVNFCRAERLPLRVIALTDEPPAHELLGALGLLPAEYVPCNGSRVRCVAALAASLPSRQPLVLGHVNLAPLALLWPAPVAVIAHGIEVWTPLPLLRRRGMQVADWVAGVSAHTIDRLIHIQQIDPQRCVRLLNALPEHQFPAVLDPEPLPADRPTSPLQLLTITRLCRGEPKGVDLVLSALARLPAGFAQYNVVGEGTDRARLTALANELDLQDRVRFLGQATDAVRDDLLRACDLFVLPSSCEGFGIVYLEAMAHGKPCIAAAVGGAPEVVLHEQTGLVIAPTPHAVQLALCRLTDPALRARLGAAGRQRVRTRFLPPAFDAPMLALLRRLSPS